MNYISYLRVSTQRQGRSGLGLEAQREAIDRFTRQQKGTVLREYVEFESGTKSDRPELLAALENCQLTGATLIIAKLDRLARNVHFVSTVMESDVEFVVCDFPQATRFTIHILAAVAEYERELISKRTKDALAVRKRQGQQLGRSENLRNMEQGRQQGTRAIMTKADQYAMRVYPRIRTSVERGDSLGSIAAALNQGRILSPRGMQGSWTTTSVRNLLRRVRRIGTSDM